MTAETSGARSQEERIFALLAHLSFFVLGVIAPLVLWLVQRGKSAYASFQAFQALLMHLVSMAVVLVTVMLYIAGLFGGLLGVLGGAAARESGGQVAGGCMIAFAVLFFVAMMSLQLVFMVFAVVAAIKTGMGEDFRYPLIGPLAERWWRSLEPAAVNGSARSGSA